MCYSTRIWADYRKYVRAYGAEVSIGEFAALFGARADGAKLKLPRALDLAFAGEPEPEVAAAGHDRTIINIKPGHVDAWLDPGGDLAAMQAIMDDKRHPFYENRLVA